ncbi:Dihydroxy-acid dehydratase chloroplastic [Zea mays]|uniref:Dihydroxy-acid dehydratase chloroplastic n=1 Tax=Zea mays TaxID=4577 RepID=A0A1D6KMD2_MAIZE|nr:Dihydroxy-acid dehydratase chloroplastic [Zea mays]
MVDFQEAHMDLLSATYALKHRKVAQLALSIVVM